MPDPDPIKATPVRFKTWKLIFAGVLATATILVGWLTVRSARSAPPEESPQLRSVLHLDTFVLNLADSKAFLRVGIDLNLVRAAKSEPGQADTSVALIRDTIIGVLVSAKADELLTPEGKSQLKNQLVQALRQRVPELGVEEVYFTEFLIQR